MVRCACSSEGFSASQAASLEALARQVMALMELRRVVNARGKALRAVREGDALHRQILESAVDYAIVTMDLDGIVTSWSAGAESITGWSETEMYGQPARRFFTEEDVAAGIPEREMKAAREEGRGNDERWHRRKDGSRFWGFGEMMPLHSANGIHIGYLKILRNRTIQREAREKLERQTNLLQTVTDYVSEAVFQLDADGAVTFANPAAARMVGWEADDLVGRNLHKIVHYQHPDGRAYPASECEFVEAVASGRALRQREAVFFRRDGTPIDVLCSNAPVVRNGHVDGAVLTVIDVTARKLDERRLRELNAALEQRVAERQAAEKRQTFLLALTDLLRKHGGPRSRMQAAIDALGKYLKVSRVGYAFVESDDRTCRLETVYVDGVGPLAANYPLVTFGEGNIANLREGKTSVYPDVEADPGTAGIGLAAYGIAAILAVPQIQEGRVRSVVYVNSREKRDWTFDEVKLVEDVAARIWDAVERARAQDELRALNATLEDQVAARTRERDRIWQVSRDMLGVANGDGEWLSVNPAWERILGWSPREVVGRPIDWLEHPDDPGSTGLQFASHTGTDQTLAFENRLRTREGGYRVLSWTAVPVEGLIYCVARDVTEERERAATLLDAEEALRQSQKMEAVGQLTGGVAHDFNNLLTVIQSSTDLLLRKDVPPERARRYIQAIADTADRAARLTGQLLSFARRQVLCPEVFDASERVSTIGDMLGTLTGARVLVTIDLPPEPCYVNADVSQFETALVNIAVNARDAMNGEGSFAIQVDVVPHMQATRSQREIPGEYVRISATDTGTGIAPDKIDRIFEPFYTTKDVGQGTGLGLSQVFGFAKQSGGAVVVESTVSVGTTFRMYLPRSEPANRGPPDAKEDDDLPVAEDACILVVEDNQDVGFFATHMLAQLGYRTRWVMDAQEALAVLAEQSQNFHVVLSDIVMPGMNGVQLGEEIRRVYPDLPVILTSGYSEVLASTPEHGFEFLQKPYTLSSLSRVLGETVR